MFGRKDRKLRAEGTRVPAVLIDTTTPGRFRDGASGSDYVYKMTWEARLPEGGTLSFTEKAKWVPPIGIWLEAAVDDARQDATLVLELGKMSKRMSKRDPEVIAASERAAKQLLGEDGGTSLAMQSMQEFRNARSLKDTLGG